MEKEFEDSQSQIIFEQIKASSLRNKLAYNRNSSLNLSIIWNEDGDKIRLENKN